MLLAELEQHLADSASVDRKAWAEEVVRRRVPMVQLLSLFDADEKTAQRFMWLLGDVCELSPETIAGVMPILFSLRHEMPFPGMRRSVAKWLGLTGVPKSVEIEAIPQMVDWLADDDVSIACKSYAAKALLSLVVEGRVRKVVVRKALKPQLNVGTAAFQHRMAAALARLEEC